MIPEPRKREWLEIRVAKWGTDELTIAAGLSDPTRFIATKNLVNLTGGRPSFHPTGSECVAHHARRLWPYRRAEDTDLSVALRCHRAAVAIITGFPEEGYCVKCDQRVRTEAKLGKQP